MGDRLGNEAHLLEQGRQGQIRLPAQACADRRQHVLDPARQPPLATEVIQDHEDPAGLHHAPHLAEDGNRIGHGRDRVGRHHLVELVVAEAQGRRVHDLQDDVRHGEGLDALDRLVQHLLRQVDAGQPARCRIERQIQAGADADLEDAVASLEGKLFDGRGTSGSEDPVEDEIVDRSQELVRAFDLPLL